MAVLFFPHISVRNKNAEKDGAYSAVFLDMLTDQEREIVEKTPLEVREPHCSSSSTLSGGSSDSSMLGTSTLPDARIRKMSSRSRSMARRAALSSSPRRLSVILAIRPCTL